MKIRTIELSVEEIESLLLRVETGALKDGDYEIIKAMAETIIELKEALQDKGTKINKLLRMLFGAKTEKSKSALPQTDTKSGKPQDKNVENKGHGRNGASDYPGAERIKVSHVLLNVGALCPECQKGKVYPLATPGVLVKITGAAPIQAKVWEFEKLRCNLCGEVFTAQLPEGVGPEKYDETSGAMIALLKYGSGLPFNRIEQLQEGFGIPLPASTQWDVVEKVADRVYPAYEELIRQAAQGEVIHNDDTTMKILDLINNDEGRNGSFTTGILSAVDGRKMALFFTGRRHAGENMAALLQQRTSGLPPPIQMCDALSRNMPKEFETILSNCLAHARRNFVEVICNFPEECRYVIESLALIYKNDKTAKEQNMTPRQRLQYHQAESGPLMEQLYAWLNEQFDDKKVEPNSGLGKAISYMLKHREPLTLFLRVEGAPLDNNLCEQILKRAILHRKNSLFYKTTHGAYIGDLFMSLIHTCKISKINPFEYLVSLQKYSKKVFQSPQSWMPWNYRAAVAELSE